jgi:hypothetical protein
VFAKLLVLMPITAPQDGFFVDENEKMERHPNSNPVFQNADAAEEKSLTED